jgi:hypothetical protein
MFASTPALSPLLLLLLRPLSRVLQAVAPDRLSAPLLLVVMATHCKKSKSFCQLTH